MIGWAHESELQICFTQGSHDDTSLPPVEHRSCEQVVVVLVTVRSRPSAARVVQPARSS